MESSRYDKEMGKRISKLREKKEMGIREAAKRIGINYSYLSRVENGYIPSNQKLKAIADFYDVDEAFLRGYEVEVPDELKGKVNRWLSFIKEQEEKGYTPEEIERIIETIEMLNRKM
jgi:transcriptional regulator with XRE-family HTH domain